MISVALAFTTCDKSEGDLLPENPPEQPETPETPEQPQDPDSEDAELPGMESEDMGELPSKPVISYRAKGKVQYSDGQPAAGIKVSDGFSVAMTDANGEYSFMTAGNDVRYIYISLPSDAGISKNSYGCPDFYQAFKPEITNTYDFTLVRQSVENQFVLFAISDPQAHNAKRDTQTMPDTDRFIGESVPAINSEIAKQTLPCYGVCLGDVIYSEASRDSSPALTIMRDHISRINVPMFCVMGNHDYTFFNTGQSISVNEGSSTINLLSQRSFEEVFGPINYSFDRGDVHFVCMKDIYYHCTTSWEWDNYGGGFTDAEYNWLVQDLENTPKDMMVVLCVHVPICQSSRGSHVQEAARLLTSFNNAVIFSGDAHYQRGVENSASSGVFEKIHPTICGQWWWSKIQGDGCPNGYTVYRFNGTQIEDSYLIGVNEGMNTRDYQMRIYKGDICTGGKYAYFQLPYSDNDYLINVFNGDPRWKVHVYEDGVYKGEAALMSRTGGDTYSKVEAGVTYPIKYGSTRDWWAIGYHIGYCKRGTSSTSYYTSNYHMWKWTASSKDASIKIKAIDPYGNEYTCEDVVTSGTSYPESIKIPLSIF